MFAGSSINLKYFAGSSSRYLFIIKFLILFSVLYAFNWAFEGIVTPRNYYNQFIDEHLNYMRLLSDILIKITSGIVHLLGYQTFTYGNWMRIVGHGGVIVEYPCLGFQVMSFFFSFVICYPKPLRSRLIFLAGGLIGIQALNICRFILLSFFWEGSFLGVANHHDLFNFCIYVFLMLSIFLWVNRPARRISAPNSGGKAV